MTRFCRFLKIIINKNILFRLPLENPSPVSPASSWCPAPVTLHAFQVFHSEVTYRIVLREEPFVGSLKTIKSLLSLFSWSLYTNSSVIERLLRSPVHYFVQPKLQFSDCDPLCGERFRSASSHLSGIFLTFLIRTRRWLKQTRETE